MRERLGNEPQHIYQVAFAGTIQPHQNGQHIEADRDIGQATVVLDFKLANYL